MTRLTLPLILECLLFFVPLNIYVIGDHMANGVQWAFFRYQQSYLGNSLILVNKDIHYVAAGILRGSSATGTIIWVSGAFLLFIAVIILAIAFALHKSELTKPAGGLTILAGALFIIAMIVEYGALFTNDHGSSVPVGAPLIIVSGIWLFVGTFDEEDEDPTGPASS
ncbi:MAG: hypothetical protein WCE65_03430 [Methanoregula sp.]